MKIAKALKLKNRLSGEVTRLKTIVQLNNSHEEGQYVNYDVAHIADVELTNAVVNLVKVKTVIACANAGVIIENLQELEKTPYWSIFMIAEIKGLIEMFRAINTKHGNFRDIRGLSAESCTTTFIAAIKQQDVDTKVDDLQNHIDRLQDTLDAYNATTSSDLLDYVEV